MTYGTAAVDLPAVRSAPTLVVRRIVFALLNAVSLGLLVAAMATVLDHGGWNPVKALILGGFALSILFPLMAFWNSVIGFLIIRLADDPVGLVNPAVRRAGADDPVTLRTALAVPIRHEDAAKVFARIEAMLESLEATGFGDRFDVHVLSDSTRADVAAAEEALVADLRARWHRPSQVHYRRRAENTDYKAGNVREFGERVRGDYDLMITLDADSYMSGASMVRLVRVMQANPGLGILQTLTMGRPSGSAFARVFQFGMRQGMRTHTIGMTWWQGDAGPYWGHNAAIRIGPFVDHCRLPRLKGTGPLGGQVLSHDQVEAAQMRGAGYEVRVIPDEFDSWEENPTSLPDFMRRDLRWCQGNMQYWQLIGMTGLKPMGRWQLVQAILMYFGSPLWTLMTVGFFSLAFIPPSEPTDAPFPVGLGVGLFAVTTVMILAPRLLGVADLLLDAEKRRLYGGTGRILGGWTVDTVFSYLLGPVMIVAQTIFMTGLLLGRANAGWDAQNRDTHAIGWGQAARGLWPQMLAGALFLYGLASTVPGALPWAAPTLVSLLLCVPFTVITSAEWAGRLAVRWRLCALPEERAAHPDLVRLEGKLARVAG